MKRIAAWSFLVLILFLSSNGISGQNLLFTEADTSRGTLTPERAWWDVHYYALDLEVFPADQRIEGAVAIHFTAEKTGDRMQIDLRQPLEVDSVLFNNQWLDAERRKHYFFIDLPEPIPEGKRDKVMVYYSGTPRNAPNPPWDGGVIWAEDDEGNPWIATACQGLGASVWWPNKDHLSDEPDSARISATVPDTLVHVSNGRLEQIKSVIGNRKKYTWFVSSPINNYNITLNIGNYTAIRDSFHGAEGALPLSYWVLKQHTSRARTHFQEEVKPMLSCFEDWFGPYPYYEDGYKLVEAPYLGMEHQSAIAYGNSFVDGYRGMDISGSGWGENWDYIIVHESGHEWWGNHLSVRDIADLWVHEGFTSYSEALYVECRYGKEAAGEYLRGARRRIGNKKPVIGPYGVNREGSGDMYFKGANLLHMIRHITDDDSLWRSVLIELQQTFGDTTTTTVAVERLMDERIATDLKPVLDQYLRHSALPVLQYYFSEKKLHLRWKATADDFNMPVDLKSPSGRYERYSAGEQWVDIPWKSGKQNIEVHPAFYIQTDEVK